MSEKTIPVYIVHFHSMKQTLALDTQDMKETDWESYENDVHWIAVVKRTREWLENLPEFEG